MGSGQSQSDSTVEQQPENTPPNMVRIERNEVPEEYRTVGISHDVVDRILNFENRTDDKQIAELKKQLAEERESNEKLRNQIKQLSGSKPVIIKPIKEHLTLPELEARKQAYKEALERVEKQYFSYRPENVCKTIENDIMDCIKQNRNKLLNCGSFAMDMKKCASNFREKVLKEMPHS